MLKINCSMQSDRTSSSGAVEMAPIEASTDGRPWYALSVRSRHEKTVAHFLESFGYVSFLPTYKARRLWSDRIKEVEAPLFPGYLFCRFDIRNRLPILMIPGVQQIVGGTKIPAPIDIAEVKALQAVVRAGAACEPWPFLKVGDRLRIEHGSLAGVEGILLQVKGRHRLVLSVTLLQRSVSVDIDSAWVRMVAREGASESRVSLTRTSTQPAM
jgi:transcription antitermination factor NusG